MMNQSKDFNYVSVTEISGDEVSREQIDRLCNRYYWAGQYCKDKDVLEVACGSGQALGYLDNISNTFEAGDYSEDILSITRKHYGNRIKLHQFDAGNMPFADHAWDVILLFEAMYYLLDGEQFVRECTRVLRPGGRLLISTANKDLYDFNPSPHSYKYYGVVELENLLSKHGFKNEFFGDTPVDAISTRQKILRPAKKLVVSLGLIPKSMAGKKLLKRLVFGNLVAMPAEIDGNTSEYVEPNRIASDSPDTRHKVIYCTATLSSTN
jgi:SAM-dependent methyltransferase